MARHRRGCSKEDRFRWWASSGQGGVTRPECWRSRWEIQRLSLAHWRMHSSPRLHPPSNSAHRWPSNSARIKHQSRHHAQPPSQAIGVCSAISAPGLIELTPFERDGLGARSLCSVMWPLLAPFASPLLAMVEYFGGWVVPVFWIRSGFGWHFLYVESTTIGLITIYVGIQTYLFPLTWTRRRRRKTVHLFCDPPQVRRRW